MKREVSCVAELKPCDMRWMIGSHIRSCDACDDDHSQNGTLTENELVREPLVVVGIRFQVRVTVEIINDASDEGELSEMSKE